MIGISHQKAANIFARPARFARTNKLVILLRGLPGSGKSTVAKNIEIHEKKFSMKVKRMTFDEYFEEVMFSYVFHY